MKHPRTAYELSQSQVTTPERVVSLFWQLTGERRTHLGTVLDMGAGDGRFALSGCFEKYVGVEIDRNRCVTATLPERGTILHGCVFRHTANHYDACVGNPPYVRHHDINSPWKEQTTSRLEREMVVALNKHCNLYVYFFCLALLKSHETGLVSLVIPYEWVSRPSAKALREYIRRHRWNVAVYRFKMPIFEGVMTTASISIVDKSHHDDRWEFYDIDHNYEIIKRRGITGSRHRVLDYSQRGEIWGLRGLSPGSQKIFTLTEGQRVHFGLRKQDVVPCVTSLRHIPPNVRVLSDSTFRKYYVEAGVKCWLIRSDRDKRSSTLNAYLDIVPKKDRQNYTCKNQSPWFKYRPHPVPRMLFGSGFTKFGPKVLVNSVKARTVGSVWGIHCGKRAPLRGLQDYLLGINFEKRVVAHAEKLKKVEVRQLNAVLNAYTPQGRKNGTNGHR
jgi:hypothetical protein